MILSPADLEPFATIPLAKAEAMIADAEALAARVAPCLIDNPSPDLLDAAKAILRRAILRWNDAGNSGSTTTRQQTAGPWSISDTMQAGSSRMFYPSEITDLQDLCRTTGKAFMIDQVQPAGADLLASRPDLRFQFG